MINIIFAKFAIAIEDIKICFGNLNLQLKKKQNLN